MGLPLVVIGLIARLIPSYFHGQYAVADVVMLVGLVLLAIQILFVIGILSIGTRRRF